MAIPAVVTASAKKITESTASAQAARIGSEVSVNGKGTEFISGASRNSPHGMVLGSGNSGAGINGSPFGVAQGGIKNSLTKESMTKTTSLSDRIKDSGYKKNSTINKSMKANEMRKDIHGFGKDMMGQDAQRNDPERSAKFKKI